MDRTRSSAGERSAAGFEHRVHRQHSDADIKEGDILTFLDGNQKPLTTGKVIRVLPTRCTCVRSAPARWPPAGGWRSGGAV